MAQESNSSARILDAALTVFSKKGYDAASTREICALAGISKPTLYYFYESKEGIYRALLQSTLGEFLQIVDEAFAAKCAFRGRCRKLAELMFEHSQRNPRRGRFVFSVFWSPNAPFAGEIHASYHEGVQRIANAAAAAVKAGEIRRGDPQTRMLVLMGALAEAMSNFLVMGTPKLTRKLAYSIIDTVLDGWQPVKTGTKA
jgi:AcrR family transcriptional regulator